VPHLRDVFVFVAKVGDHELRRNISMSIIGTQKPPVISANADRS